MRILFVLSEFPVRSETFIQTQIAGLLARGHEVDICANVLNDATDLHSDFSSFRLMERVRLRRRATEGDLARRVVRRAGLLARHVLREPALTFKALDVFRFGKKALSLDLLDMALCFRDRPRYDVVHCHFGSNGNDAALLLELGVLQGKLVVTFHSYDVLAGQRTSGRIYRRLVRRADSVHSISDYNRRALESFGFPRERIEYHPMGIRLEQFAPGTRDVGADAVRILTVARLAPAKGLEYALSALAGLRRRRPDLRWRYRIIGGGELLGALRAHAAHGGIGDLVEFLGPQDQEVVRSELRDADIFLLPSLAEALPIAIMEAMASEVPVIATDVGAVGELVREGETGRLVPPGDAAALESALASTIDAAPQERWRLAVAGRRLVMQRHDTDVVTDRLIEHYRELLAGKPGERERGPARDRARPAAMAAQRFRDRERQGREARVGTPER